MGARVTTSQTAKTDGAPTDAAVEAAVEDRMAEILSGAQRDSHVWARWLGLAMLLAAAAIAFIVGDGGTAPFFQPSEWFILLAGFYVAAQAVERLLQPLAEIIPPRAQSGAGKAVENLRAKNDRAIILLGLACLAGVALSAGAGLYFLDAISASKEPPRGLDIFVTGLIIAGGTKPLHDLISRIEKSKEKAEKEVVKETVRAAR
jgi:hypothetical protein